MASFDLARTAMDLAEAENATEESPKSNSCEILVTFVFRHELTDGAAERNFPKELFEKVQEVKNGRREIMLALDPFSIAIGDIKGFLLEEYGMKSMAVEKIEQDCIAQMIMMADTKVVLDSDKIYDLIVGGNLEKIHTSKGDSYILHYIFLRSTPKISSPTHQQKTIDALLKNLAPLPPSTLSIIRPPSFSPSTISPTSSCSDTSPEPEAHQPPVTSSPKPPETETEKTPAETASHPPGTEGTKETGRKKRGRVNKDQPESPEIPVRLRMNEPDGKRMRTLVPNIKLSAIPIGQNGVSGGGQQVVGNGGGAMTVGKLASDGWHRKRTFSVVTRIETTASGLNAMFPLSTSPVPYPLHYPLLPIPPLGEHRPLHTVPQIPRSPNRRWTFSAQELTVMSHLAVGHKKVTITFEDDNGTSQTICVENRQ